MFGGLFSYRLLTPVSCLFLFHYLTIGRHGYFDHPENLDDIDFWTFRARNRKLVSIGSAAMSSPRACIALMNFYTPTLYHDVMVAHNPGNMVGLVGSEKLATGWFAFFFYPSWPMIQLCMAFFVRHM